MFVSLSFCLASCTTQKPCRSISSEPIFCWKLYCPSSNLVHFIVLNLFNINSGVLRSMNTDWYTIWVEIKTIHRQLLHGLCWYFVCSCILRTLINYHLLDHNRFNVRVSMQSTGWTVPPKIRKFVERMFCGWMPSMTPTPYLPLNQWGF